MGGYASKGYRAIPPRRSTIALLFNGINHILFSNRVLPHSNGIGISNATLTSDLLLSLPCSLSCRDLQYMNGCVVLFGFRHLDCVF